jgi:hypothetical protein
MISQKLILKQAPSGMGEQTHVNHEGCEAGEDTKRRLYIKRVSGGIVAYCHHCSDSGFVREAHHKEHLPSFKGEGERKTIKLPPTKPLPDLISYISPFGRMWLEKYHIDAIGGASFMGVRGNQYQVALRLLNKYSYCIGWQLRNVKPGSTGPKYITHYFNTSFGTGSWRLMKSSDCLTITEDYLSAYRIARDTGSNTFALLGTNLTDKSMLDINEKGFNNIRIWLDNDDAGRKGSVKIFKKLSYYLPKDTNISIIYNDVEPKQLSPKELHGLFTTSPMLGEQGKSDEVQEACEASCSTKGNLDHLGGDGEVLQDIPRS